MPLKPACLFNLNRKCNNYSDKEILLFYFPLKQFSSQHFISKLAYEHACAYALRPWNDFNMTLKILSSNFSDKGEKSSDRWEDHRTNKSSNIGYHFCKINETNIAYNYGHRLNSFALLPGRIKQLLDMSHHNSKKLFENILKKALNKNYEARKVMKATCCSNFVTENANMVLHGKFGRQKLFTGSNKIEKKRPLCEYTVLEDEAVLQDRLEMDRKLQRDADRNLALINCQQYLQNSTRYVFIQQLNDIGSRIDKHWFLVRDMATKTDRLLVMMPITDNCAIHCNITTQRALIELFVAFQHPYIYPVLDVDFKLLNQQQFAVLVIPFNHKGSLKDLIYQSDCHHDWREKYQYYGKGLNESQIQQLGRQILEGMIFLQEYGFPTFAHLHCGNIIVQNGVARISGLENTLLGNTTRIYYLLQKYICDNQDSIESICFGHLLFEMAAGYELSTPRPKEKNYKDLQHCPRVVKVLRFIFRNDGAHHPPIQEISRLEFFRYIDLRELRLHSFPAKLSPSAQALLQDVHHYQKYHIRNSPFNNMPLSKQTSEYRSIEDKHMDSTQWRTVSPYHRKSESHTLYIV